MSSSIERASRELSRRKFIGACCSAVGATGMLSALAQLRLIGAVAQPASDFKALVCLFLAGGNDANNLIIPNDPAGYAAYAASRGALALPQSGLLGIAPATSDGREWALHPAVPDLRDLFTGGRLAFLANTGSLVVPTTKAQYQARSVTLPPQLFSHSDQQVQWQSSVPDKPFTTGWGGRLADLVNAFNENPTISMSISLAGKNSFQVGSSVAQYAVNSSGVVQLAGTTGAAGGIRLQALKDLMNPLDAGLFATAFGDATGGAIEDAALLAGILGATSPFTTAFPTSSLGQQLRMIAWLIHVAPQLGLKRQVFFARVGGWDLHDNQVDPLDTSAGAHATLLADLGASLKAFNDATTELGLADSVTAFTASDFGRTFNTNGDGSDHGWGSHHLIMGGAVRGGDIYGTIPELVINGPDDTGRGRWIPTTSVDEYSATLARWFGVSELDLPLVLPNIGRFANPDLGFML
jgi:uncharacterized protein (DUF1501 family)